jgi:hypothetical protein
MVGVLTGHDHEGAVLAAGEEGRVVPELHLPHSHAHVQAHTSTRTRTQTCAHARVKRDGPCRGAGESREPCVVAASAGGSGRRAAAGAWPGRGWRLAGSGRGLPEPFRQMRPALEDGREEKRV